MGDDNPTEVPDEPSASALRSLGTAGDCGMEEGAHITRPADSSPLRLSKYFSPTTATFAARIAGFLNSTGMSSQHMDAQMFHALLTELKQGGVHTLELSGGGEPLDHPDILIVV